MWPPRRWLILLLLKTATALSLCLSRTPKPTFFMLANNVMKETMPVGGMVIQMLTATLIIIGTWILEKGETHIIVIADLVLMIVTLFVMAADSVPILGKVFIDVAA